METAFVTAARLARDGFRVVAMDRSAAVLVNAAAPDDIAHAVAFLANPATHFITGQTLFVDGGKSLSGLSI